MARLSPRLPRTSAGDQRLDALVNRPVDELIAEVQAAPPPSSA
ncbi:Type III effector HopAV1 [Pseudomonas syringae pv. theae]|uniref:Type III effector HopAV1 n=1 Tax=Pseudomonas syringae pv. theae TaxID=103985 RepID=A0A3M5NE95_PSESX|nr:Type III effector HopAV1 [Pseudomonas syringae pv. theae]